MPEISITIGSDEPMTPREVRRFTRRNKAFETWGAAARCARGWGQQTGWKHRVRRVGRMWLVEQTDRLAKRPPPTVWMATVEDYELSIDNEGRLTYTLSLTNRDRT